MGFVDNQLVPSEQVSVTGSSGKLREVSIYRGAWNLLQSLLVQGGWTKDALLLTKGTRVSSALEDMLDATIRPEQYPNGATPEFIKEWTLSTKSWANEGVKLFITEKESDAIKACLKYYIGEGRLIGNRYAGALLDEFGFGE